MSAFVKASATESQRKRSELRNTLTRSSINGVGQIVPNAFATLARSEVGWCSSQSRLFKSVHASGSPRCPKASAASSRS